MKLETLQQKVSIIRGEEAEDTQYGIDAKNMHLAIQAFYQYSDPLGSIIREITSNAFDAHIEAGVHKPVIVQIDTKEQALNILDFGVGLSPQRVNDIFTKFFSSTKRESNDQIGAFGLGSKSPLSYTDMFQVTTKYGNMVYEYVIHKADGVPALVRLDQSEWVEDTWPWKTGENGTKVSIPFKDSDSRAIITKAKKQLCYFDNVLINVFPGSADSSIEDFNKEAIYRGDHIIYRETSSPEYGIDRLHMCMGKVYYPLESISSHIYSMNNSDMEVFIEEAAKEELGDQALSNPLICGFLNGSIDFYDFCKSIEKLPMAIYFDIGDLPILWHRENIEYTDQAWQTIIKKMVKVGLEIQKLQDAHFPVVTNFKDALQAQYDGNQDSGKYVYLSKEALQATGREIEIPELVEVAVKANIKKDIFTPFRLMSSLYETHKDSKATPVKELAGRILGDNTEPIYRVDDEERRKANLPAFMESKKYLTIVPNRSYELPDKLEDPAHITIYRKYVKQVFDLIDAHIPEANNIVLPEHFKRTSAATKASEIPLMYRDLDNYYEGNYRRTDLKDTINGKQDWKALRKLPSFLVYGFYDDREMLNSYCMHNKSTALHQPFGRYATSYDKPRPLMGLISKETASFIGDIVPSIWIYDFMEHRRGIQHIATNFLVYRYLEKYPWFSDMLDNIRIEEWARLKFADVITQEEHSRIRKIDDLNPKNLSKSSKFYSPVMRAIKRGYYYQDELDFIKWAHGMYAKYAPLLYLPDFVFYSKDKPAEQIYFNRASEHVHSTINPNLYRKYHVKNIEQIGS